LEPIIQEPSLPASACVIWMHGLGADAQDMLGLATQMHWGSHAVRQVFMNAPIRPVTLNHGMAMPAWYDITGTSLTDREDEDGIRASAETISTMIAKQVAQGISQNRIFLAGFSQGGAMALYTGLLASGALGGVAALSAYLPLSQTLKPRQYHQTPIFIGGGRFDPVVLPPWTDASEQWLKQHNFHNIHSFRYPMEHSICLEEVRDLEQWFMPLLEESK